MSEGTPKVGVCSGVACRLLVGCLGVAWELLGSCLGVACVRLKAVLETDTSRKQGHNVMLEL